LHAFFTLLIMLHEVYLDDGLDLDFFTLFDKVRFITQKVLLLEIRNIARASASIDTHNLIIA
jgi:hypothetical protein